jgi:adenine-specific DNA-methyltransferase
MVQLPENLDENFTTATGQEKEILRNAIALCDRMSVPHELSEISKERIRRSATKIKTENPVFAENLDLGFKHYRLTTPTATTLDKIIEFDPSQSYEQELFGNMIDKLGGLETILQTWLIDGGNTFDTKIENIDLSSYTAQYISESKTLYLINQEFNTEALKAMLNKIGTGELFVSTIVVYPYSFGFEIMRELEVSVKTLEDVPQIKAPNIIKKY